MTPARHDFHVSHSRAVPGNMFTRILLATHGTAGALSAEEFAMNLASASSAELICLHVINRNWKWITGDDWLNTSACRNKFRRYVEDEINSEADAILLRVKDRALARSVEIRTVKGVGLPAETILQTAAELDAEVIVMGARQKKQSVGFRSRIPWRNFLIDAAVPVIVVPRRM